MAVVITLTADASGVPSAARLAQTSITQALAGIDAKMQDTARKTGQATDTWRSSLTGLSQAVQRTHVEQGHLSKAFLQTGQAAGMQVTALQRLQQAYAATTQASKGATSGITALLSGLRGAAGALGLAVGVGVLINSLKEFAVSVVEAGIAHERLMLQLKGALGTAQAAGEAYAFVEGVANRLGVGLNTAVEGFARLSAATQGTVVQGQVTRDLFVAISEASRVMGLTSAETGGIVTALTQIIGKNTVSMEELRQQLGERLPSALRLTAKEMGVTTSKFIEMVSKGEVLAVDFIPAITRAMQQMGKEAPAAAASVQAALERLGNAWLTLKVTIAQSGILPLVSGIMEEMTRVVNQTTNWINRTKRLSGELGLAPMVAEMQRVTQEIQMWQEVLQDPGAIGTVIDQANTAIKALEGQRNALAQNISVKQKDLEVDEKARKSAEATTKIDIENAEAKQKEIALVSKATGIWTDNAEAITKNELALKALRSMDVDVLQQAFQIDPFTLSTEDFKARLDEAEAILLKQQKDLLDKRAGLDKGAAATALREEGQSAVELAKAREQALATGLKNETTLVKQASEERRRIADDTATKELMAEGPGAVEAIARRRSETRKTIAVEEAKALETIELQGLKDRTTAREAVLNAEIASAGKNLSAKVAAEEELRNLPKETAAERVKIETETAKTIQGISKKSVDEQIAHARDLNKILQEIEADRLKGRIGLVDEQIALTQAQMDGMVLTTEEGLAQIQALETQRFADRRKQLERDAQAQIDEIKRVVQEEDVAARQIQRIRQGLAIDIHALDIQQQTQAQAHRNELLEGWREWVQDVQSAMGSFLVDLFEGQIKSIASLFDRLKIYFFETIAKMIAYAATHAVVIPIVSAVVGGLGAAAASGATGAVGAATGATGASSGFLGTGSTVLTGLGLAKSVYSMLGMDTLTSSVGTGLSTLKETLLTGIDSIFSTTLSATNQAVAVNTALAADLAAGVDTAGLGASGTAGTVSGTAGALAGNVAGIGGGLLAIGGGIYGALNAANVASKAAFAASAAAGAVATAAAAYGAVTGGALVIAGTTGWTGIGLIAAAVMAVIGVVLDKVIKPAGPALAVGQVSGLGIGTQGGQLAVSGDLGSRVMRRDKVDPGVAAGVQAQMEEGLTNAVVSIVQTINAVALDPTKLLGPTQEALQRAMQAIRPINSANAKKMEQDITEQLRFVNVQIVSGMLGPLNEAFNQLRDDGSLAEQLDRLPATTAGLVEVFKTMNTQLSEIAGSKNTDVLRQLSGVRSQVELFGARIAETAGQVAERIVDQLVTSLQSTVVPTLAGQITQFAGLMDASLRALSGLRATQQRLEGAGLQGGGVGGQIDRLVEVTALTAERISTEIVSGALQHLSADLNTVLIQPVRVQATTVNGLFNDSLAALNSLWVEWHRLENEGINAGRVREQFDRLVGGMLDSIQRLTEDAFDPENFAAFLGVLLSIPEALSNLNPVRAAVRQVGVAFAQVVAPIQQVIDAAQVEMQTPQARAGDAAQRMAELGDAIAQTGDTIDQALPLYAQMGQAIQASAAAQIEVVNAAAEEMTQLVQAEYDAMLQIVQTWADQEIQAINDFTDAATAQYNAYFDAYTDAVNGAFDAQRDAWDRWAEDMMAGLQGFIDASTSAVNTWADAANMTAGQLETVNRTILAEMSPTRQRAELEQRKAIFEAQAAGGGPVADRALSELISINTDLLALAKSSDNLALQQRSIDELRVLQKILEDRLYAATGETDPVLAQIKVSLIQKAALENIEAYQKAQTAYITKTQQAAVEAIEQRRRDHLNELEIIRVRVQEGFEAVRAARLNEIEDERTRLEEQLATDRDKKLEDIRSWQEATVKAIKVDMVYELRLVQLELQKLFVLQYKALTGIDLPAPTPPTVPVAAQLGGLIAQASINWARTGPLALAQGGMVPALLEPGERVISGPMTHAQQGALMALNTAVPRFTSGGWTVPGSGSGDSVPALVPSGSFILNRNASRAMGYQQGGPVSHGGPTDQSRHVNIHLNLQGSTFSKNITLEELKALLETLQRRGLQR